jgi:hypothetical protein
VTLPDGAKVDEAAPDGSGFTDEQKQKIIAFLPQAKDAGDLERFSLELSGGKAKIGNAEAILDDLKKGHKAEDFAFTPPVVRQDMTKGPDQPLTMDHVRTAVRDALMNVIAPGLGPQLGEAAEPVVKPFLEHAANAVAGDYGPELGGVIDTVLHGGDISNNAAHERAIMEGDSEGHPIASAAGELAGIAVDAPIAGAVADAAGLGKIGRIVQQAVEGAAYGSGAAGPGNRAAGAAAGAVAAPVVGAVAKAATAVPGLVKEGAKTVLEGSQGLARRIIARAIKDDANTPETVAQDIAAAHANDVPMALADTGENARGLLAAASRSSGMARTVARDALEERQAQLADRVTSAIQRDLGPVANPHELADSLMTRARDEAAPLYEAAYTRAGADTFGQKAARLMQRPSMQRALANAYRIAKEEGRDPNQLGFDLNSSAASSRIAAGSVLLSIAAISSCAFCPTLTPRNLIALLVAVPTGSPPAAKSAAMVAA